MTQIDETLIQRVRKLFDKAESTDNPHEAELFAHKAAELVARHRIDPDHLASDRLDELEIREIPIGRGAYVRGRLALVTAVAEANDVRIVFQATPTGTIAFAAGHRSDLDVVEVMYTSLHAQAASQMESQRRSTGPATMRHRRSFLFGFAERVGQILADAQRAAAPTGERSSSVEMALRTRRERVDEFAAESWGRVRSARPAASAQAAGWSAGTAAAERADVGRSRLAGRQAIGPGST